MVKRPKKVPLWMDCGWKRDACGRADCRVCGPIANNRQVQLEKGQDPDSWEAALADVASNLEKTLAIVRQDAEKMGIDIDNIQTEGSKEPPAESYPVYQKLKSWREEVNRLAEQARENEELWPVTEPGEDLLWYANTVLSKTYRQLINRWELDQGDNNAESDYLYTRYVLYECIETLKKSLSSLLELNMQDRNRLNLLYVYLSGMEKEVIDI